MLAFPVQPLDHLVTIGAHCDDIGIGAGGALLTLCQANPGLRVTALVLTGAGTEREHEERLALASLCPKADVDLTVLDLPDGRLPAHWTSIKDALHELRSRADPDVVFAPAAHDAHQDHRAIGELVPTVLRDHLVLGYEILKWESDLQPPNTYLSLDDQVVEQKAELLVRHYGSQRDRDWFDVETFTGLARVRGVQCHARYAEAFHVSKLRLCP